MHHFRVDHVYFMGKPVRHKELTDFMVNSLTVPYF